MYFHNPAHYDTGEEQGKTSAQDTVQDELSMDDLHVKHPSQAVIQCDDCKTSACVAKFCKTCPKSLCEKCAILHRREQRHHDIVPRTGEVIRESELSMIVRPCHIHQEYNAEKFCNNCSVPICIKCGEEKHDNHSTVAIGKKYMECEDELNDQVRNMETDILPTLVSNVEQLNKTLDLQEQRLQEVEKEVNEFRERLKTMMDERCDKIIDELRQKYKNQTSDIGVIISELEKQIKNTELLISICSEKVRGGGLDLIEFSNVTPPTTDTLLSNISYTIPTFVPGQNMLNCITNLIGNLKWEDKEINLTKPSNPRIPDSEYLKPDIDIKPLGSFRTDVSGNSVVPTGKDAAWVTSTNSDTMTMYDISGKIIRSVNVGAKVWDIAVNQSGDVIVSNTDKKVRLVTVDDAVNDLIDTAPYSPWGMCLNEKEEIVVCMVGDENHVAVYSPDGKKQVRKIVVKDDKGNQLLTHPYRVVMNGEYISVMNDGSIVMTCDEDGKVVWVYDGSQTEVWKLFATGMCVDKFRNLLISDWENNCVHYVDRDGGLIKILLTRDQHGIDFPFGIGVDDETGTVWVGGGQWKKKVWIFRYLQT